MNTHKGLMLTAALAIAVATAAPSFAQSQLIRATIPFDFYVADRMLPAGEYTIAPQSSANAIRVYDDRGNSAFVLTTALNKTPASNSSRLVFRRYGNTAFLSGVYWQGFGTVRDLASSKMEKKIAQGGVPALQAAVRVK